MLVSKINDYFEIGFPVLHFGRKREGWHWDNSTDLEQNLFTLYLNGLNQHDKEILLFAHVEFGAFEKRTEDEWFVIPILKIGTGQNIFLFPCPFDPTDRENKHLIDKWLNSKILVIELIDDSEMDKWNCSSIQALRVLTVSCDIQVYFRQYINEAAKESPDFSLKYFKWCKEVSAKEEIEQMWESSVKLGVFEE